MQLAGGKKRLANCRQSSLAVMGLPAEPSRNLSPLLGAAKPSLSSAPHFGQGKP